MQMMALGQNSYWSWARAMSHVIGERVSKPAIFYRMNTAWVATVKALVIEVVGQQAGKKIKHKLFSGFKNVWIQDSTCIHLPQALIKRFTGSVVNGNQNSVAKLNVIVNALTGLCPVMEWSSYTLPEQTLSSNVLSIAKAGDLVIRDLGYFVLSVFAKMNNDGIYFLSKWMYKVALYEIQTGKQINLLQLLKGKSHLDIQVLCGSRERVKVRLVAVKLSTTQTAERIRKVKKNQSKRTKYGVEYIALLGYVIFITNVDEKTWNCQQVAEAYRVRWNIEILFKSWKSGLSIERMIPDARIYTERVESILYLLLLYIVWFQLLVYVPLSLCNEKGISVIQAAKWMFANINYWIRDGITNKMKDEICYYCCYETRRRPNASNRLESFSMPLT
jgi:DDE family transposase